MIKKELLTLINDRIEDCIERAKAESNSGESLINIGIELAMLRSFHKDVKKEKAFNIKASQEEVGSIFLETLREISDRITAKITTELQVEARIGMNILSEEMAKTRKKNRGK